MCTPQQMPGPRNAEGGGPGHLLLRHGTPRLQDTLHKWPLKGVLLGSGSLCLLSPPSVHKASSRGPAAWGSHSPGPSVHPHLLWPIVNFHFFPGAAQRARMGFDPRWSCLDPPPTVAGKAGLKSVPGAGGRGAQPGCYLQALWGPERPSRAGPGPGRSSPGAPGRFNPLG